jgi:hypothetical protein
VVELSPVCVPGMRSRFAGPDRIIIRCYSYKPISTGPSENGPFVSTEIEASFAESMF